MESKEKWSGEKNKNMEFKEEWRKVPFREQPMQNGRRGQKALRRSLQEEREGEQKSCVFDHVGKQYSESFKNCIVELEKKL